jgi:CSLREA domain-containing protein
MALILLVLILQQAVAQAATTRVVTKLADTDDGVCDTDCSLREAIDVAVDGDAVTFANDVRGTITLELGRISTSTIVEIIGPGASNLTIAANPNSPDRAFRFYAGTAPDEIVVISGLTVTGGRGQNGAGFFFQGANGELNRMVVTGNTGPSGGGIYSFGAYTLRIIDSEITNNVADDKGGGLFALSEDLLIEGSTFSDNTALQGGGIWNGALDTSRIANTTISGNIATGDEDSSGNPISRGGGMFLSRAVLGAEMTHVTITDNEADLGGGFVSHFVDIVASSTVDNSILFGNTALEGPDCWTTGGHTHAGTSVGWERPHPLARQHADRRGRQHLLVRARRRRK